MKIQENSNILDLEKGESLEDQARQFEKLWNDFSEIPFQEDKAREYYILSTQFLKNWKLYVSYDEIISGQPTKHCNEEVLKQLESEQVNIDLIDEEYDIYSKANSKVFQYQKIDDILNTKHWNVFLKTDLQEQADYIFIDKPIWKFFRQRYKGIKIKRKVFRGVDGSRKIEVNYRRLKIVAICQNELKNIEFDNFGAEEFQQIYDLQVSHKMSFKKFASILQEQICLILKDSNTYVRLDEDDALRFLALDSKYTLDSLYQQVKQKAGSTYGQTYSIEVEGEYLNYKSELGNQKMEDLDIEGILLLDLNQMYRGFNFQCPGMPMEGKCENCYNIRELKVQCACKKVAYCCDECKQNDWRFHEDKCDAPIDEGEGPQENPQSKYGITGLSNIGNTCFMNSGLQCLSNCYELTQYFLEGKYNDDMNIDAPLGTKGELTKSYAVLIKKLWHGNQQSQNPRNFKKVLSKFHSIFEGFNQHDSQEFLTELLSSMSEDLNLVKKKKFVEAKDDDGVKDYWNNFVLRNNSILTHLINGQFKSELKCPDCDKISITYDPYIMISLPIPKEAKGKSIQIVFIDNDEEQTQRTINISYQKNSNHRMINVYESVKEMLDLSKDTQVLGYVASDMYFDCTAQESDSTCEIRKKGKYRSIIVRALNQFETDIPQKQRIQVNIVHKRQAKGSYYPTSLVPIRRYVLGENDTMKQVHLKFFRLVKHFLKGLYDEDLSDEEIYEQLFRQYADSDDEKERQKQPYVLSIHKNSGYWNECFLCGKKSCQDCPLKYNDDMTLGELKQLIEKNKTYSSDDDLEFLVHWEFLNDNYMNNNNQNHFKLHTIVQAEKRKQLAEDNQIEIEEKKEPENDVELDVEPQQNGNIVGPLAPNTAIQTNGYTRRNRDNEQQQQQGEELSLEKCLHFFQQPEKLDVFNEVYCRNCKDHKQMDKKMSIQSVPRVLIFHFKRFYRKNPESILMKKLNNKIDFPVNNLDLKNYVLSTNIPGHFTDQNGNTLNEGQIEEELQNNKQSLLYDLFAVSNHSGSLLGGHYTAFAKNSHTGKWYHYNDSSVSEIQEEEVVTSGAYVLFYRRKDTQLSQNDIQEMIYKELYEDQLQGQIDEIQVDNNN